MDTADSDQHKQQSCRTWDDDLVDTVSGENIVTPLHSAAANGKAELVMSLLRAGCKVDERNYYGWTPLMQAARQGHKSIVVLLLQNGADANAVNQYGVSCLACAVKSGNQPTVEALLKAGAEIMYTNEIAPIAIAAQHGLSTIAHVLIDNGADVNQTVKSAELTPLMLAVTNNIKAITQLLIDRSCDVNAMNSRSATAFDIAVSNGNVELRLMLEPKTAVRDQQGDTEIIDAVKAGDMMLLRSAVAKSLSKLDFTEAETGLTALMFATISNRIDLVQFLVECGADLNKQDTLNGWSAFMHAVFNGRKAVARYLITIGCNAVQQDFYGRTAFDVYADLEDECDAAFFRLLAENTYFVDESVAKSAQTIKKDSNNCLKVQVTHHGVTTSSRPPRSPCTGFNGTLMKMTGGSKKASVSHTLCYGANRKRSTSRGAFKLPPISLEFDLV